MSIFTNPASGAGGDADGYVTAILELLGDRDPHAVLRTTPSAVRDHIDGRSLDAIRNPEAPRKWSALEVVQHLADSDLVWAFRLRMVVAEDRPELTGYDQDRWAARLRYCVAMPQAALEQFDFLRRLNLRLLGSLTVDDHQRVGEHKERGPESVAHMIRLYAGHDLVHLRQLRRILERVT